MGMDNFDLLRTFLRNWVSHENKNRKIESNSTSDNVTAEEVREQSKIFAKSLNIDTETTHFQDFLNEVVTEFSISMGVGESLVKQNDYDHDMSWAKRKDINWYYSSAYETLLYNSFPPQVVPTLTQNSLNMLCSLGDPKSTETWDRRGLIFGHVQSGKTANFIGLIARAADAGYRMIIVLTTNDEKLRSQTQKRIDEGFIGHDTGDDNKEKVGVGAYKNYNNPISITTTKTDNLGSIRKTNITPEMIEKPWLVILKKNTRRLEDLHGWLKTDAVNDKIQDMPLLLIDDEADWASIDTTKPEENPTLTNQWIRTILKLYKKSSYVGVTATPFANIFINHESYTDMLEDDLFPRDWIYSLDPPDNYFGGNKLFLDSIWSNKIIEHIYDAEDYFPTGKNFMHRIQGIPDSLKTAFLEFILAKSIRTIRGHKNKHCTMMVNAHTRKEVTQSIYDEMVYFIKIVKESVLSNYRMSDSFALRDPIMKELKYLYDKHHSGSIKEKWEEVKEELYNSIDDVKPSAEYSGSIYKGLDYESYEKSNQGLTALAIGGFSLSRGLTLEGLTVSYLYRDTKFGDTLLQLGRFFGYRDKYEDLVRVHMRESARKNFNDICDSIENLRIQIRQMIGEHKSPKEFGLYMYNTFSYFKISAPSKMRSAVQKEIIIGYSGKIIRSDQILNQENILQNNEQTIASFINDISSQLSSLPNKSKGRKKFDRIQTASIIQFLRDYTYTEGVTFKFSTLCNYLESQLSNHPYFDVVFDCDDGQESIANINFNFGYRRRSTWIFSEVEGYWRNPSSAISGPSDLRHAITDKQLENLRNNNPHKNVSDFINKDFQSVLENPVLWIMPFIVTNEKNDNSRTDKVYGIEVFYPFIGRDVKQRVMVNTVQAKQLDLPLDPFYEEHDEE
jgi:hypothetical protein